MRGTGLRYLLIFLDIVALGAIAGAVYLCFFTPKLNADVPQPVIQSISIPQIPTRSVGFTADEASAFAAFAGGKRSSDIAPVTNPGEAPKTVLDIELEKIEVRATAEDTESPADSFCCIRDTETSEQKMLFVGDEYKGWKLIRVKGTNAVFAYKGEEKALELTKEPLVAANTGPVNPNMPNQGNPGNPNNPNNPNAWQNPNNPGNRGPNSNTGANQPKTNAPIRREINRSFLKDLSNKADKVIQDVYAKPFVVNGKAIGMQVQSIVPNSPLNSFGIMPGDIIKTWNGQQINSEPRCYEILKQYRNNIDSVPASNEVIIIRNGQEIRLNINLR
jgi:type II secretory pathway component PulC